MDYTITRHTFLKSAAATAAVLSIFGLGACGGGADGKPDAVAAKSSAHEATAPITVEGQSTALSSELQTVAVMLPPVTWKADGSLPEGNLRFGSGASASALKAQAPGAYTTLPLGKEVLSLSKGTVTDIAGNGDFAIGRWTAGSDSAGYSYNANQGRAWALGAQLPAPVVAGDGMRCELKAATRPTASDGNTAPGVMSGATAAVAQATHSPARPDHVAKLSFKYSIGSDLNQTFTTDVPVGAMVLQKATRSSFASKFVGTDAQKPYLVVSYGFHAPTVGLINGIAVLHCSK